jgi:hypothetical protein
MLMNTASPVLRAEWAFFSQPFTPQKTPANFELGGAGFNGLGFFIGWMGVFFADTGYKNDGNFCALTKSWCLCAAHVACHHCKACASTLKCAQTRNVHNVTRPTEQCTSWGLLGPPGVSWALLEHPGASLEPPGHPWGFSGSPQAPYDDRWAARLRMGAQ